MILKVRFKEVKGKELDVIRKLSNFFKCAVLWFHPTKHFNFTPPLRLSTTTKVDEGHSRMCYHCGLEGHMARACLYPKPAGKAKRYRVSQLTSHGDRVEKQSKETFVKLSRKLKVAKLDNHVENVAGIMQILFLGTLPATTQIGPTVGLQLK